MRRASSPPPCRCTRAPGRSRSRRTGWSRRRRSAALGIGTPAFAAVDDRAGLDRAVDEVGGLPAVLKTRRGGYDGKGQRVLRAASDLDDAWADLSDVPLILEQLVPFDRELSVLAVRGLDGEVASWPLVENHHEGGILRISRAPAPGLDAALQRRGEERRGAPARRPRPRRRPRGGALRRRWRAPGQRDRAAGAQLRPLDHRGRGDQPVREPPPSDPRPAARGDRPVGARAPC